MNKKTVIAAGLILLFSGMLIGAPISVDTAAVVNTNTCDKISWTDSSGLLRTGSIVKINGNPLGYKGGYFSQVTYMDGASTVTCNESSPGGDLSGLGFMINHQPTGYAGRGWANSKQDGFNGTTTILFQGANHVIYQTEMDMYGDNGNTALGAWKVKWVYMIRTGNDYIVDSIAYDFSSKPYGTYGNDIRSPYCEINWTGTGAANTLSESIDGIEFCATNGSGVSYIFKTNGSSPFSTGYTYNTPGRNIPYTLQWKNSPDREAGYIATLDLAQQAAAGGYLGQNYIGSTSTAMPQNWGINYQANGFQGWYGDKMTWGMPYGSAGGETAAESGTTTKSTFPDWTWRKNWPAYPTNGFTLLIHLGKKTDDNVRKLAAESADIHGLINPLTASVGTVATTGKINLYDSAAFTLKPAGYNHLYHAWEVACAADAANVTLALGAVSLKNQTFIFNNFNGSSVPAVSVGGSAQSEGTDMFTSLDTVNKKLYVTFNKIFTGTTNIVIGGPAYTPTITPTIDLNASCVNLSIDRSLVPSMAFMKKLTLKVHIGDCASAAVLVDGVTVPSVYNPATKIIMFTAEGNDIVINRSGYTGGATNAVTKATLYNDMKWAYSFTFDDARPNARLVAFPVLQGYGYKAGIGLNTQQMTASTDGYVMSWASADILRSAGWSFFDHNYSHLAVTCANISTETVPVKTAIEARWPGYLCTHFVYPYCNTTDWACIRDSGLFVSAENFNGNNYADVLPASPFLLNRNSMMSAGNAGTAALANALADNAAGDARARWMIMFTHDVAPGSTAPATTYDTNEDVFGAHITYLYNTYGAGGLDNMWFAPSDEVMHYLLTREYAAVNFTGAGACGAITPATATVTRTNTPFVTPTNTPLTSDCLLDDMDDNNTLNNFGGYWYSFPSGAGSTVVPAVFAMTAGGYNSSAYAARLNGTVGTVADYSQIVMATQLNVNAGSPANGGTGQVTDISGCGGLSFYVKGDGKQYYVKLPYTDVDENSLTGYNDYKYPFTAPSGWTLVTVLFSQFTQETGWGTTVPLATVLQNAKNIQFLTAFTAPSGTVTADLWVDDLFMTACSACPGAATATFTPTATATDVITQTFTATATATRTATAVITQTFTGTATVTRTETQVLSPTNTATGTSTATQTAVVSPTHTPTGTATWTSSPVYTPTNTRSSTQTATATNSSTFTLTRTATITVTNTHTAVITMTATLTPTTAPAECLNFYIDRAAVPAMVFMRKLTVKVNVGVCSYCTVYVDGSFVPSYYNPSTQECMFTTDGAAVQVFRQGYVSGGTNAASKAVLYRDKKWAYSFTFDDGRLSQKTNAFPILSSYGYRAGVALSPSNMSQTVDGWAMSWASADILRAAGWSFFDHNYSHQVVTCANISTETQPVITAIDARWGPSYRCTHFVYPYVNITNWTCIRDSGLLLSAENFSGVNYADTAPANPFLMNRYGFYGTNVSTPNSWADSAASDARNRWLIVFTHDVENAAVPVDPYSTNIATFTSHISYVYNTYGEGGADNMWFAPSDEVMQYILTRENSTITFTGSGACAGVTPVTPSPSRTPSCTPTSTPVYSATSTRTPTPTRTRTPVFTATPTATATATQVTDPNDVEVIAFPNPAVDTVRIRFSGGLGADKAEISVYTVAFRLVSRDVYPAAADNTYTISVARMAGGSYIVRSRLLKNGAQLYSDVQPLLKIRQ